MFHIFHLPSCCSIILVLSCNSVHSCGHSVSPRQMPPCITLVKNGVWVWTCAINLFQLWSRKCGCEFSAPLPWSTCVLLSFYYKLNIAKSLCASWKMELIAQSDMVEEKYPFVRRTHDLYIYVTPNSPDYTPSSKSSLLIPWFIVWQWGQGILQRGFLSQDRGSWPSHLWDLSIPSYLMLFTRTQMS